MQLDLKVSAANTRFKHGRMLVSVESESHGKSTALFEDEPPGEWFFLRAHGCTLKYPSQLKLISLSVGILTKKRDGEKGEINSEGSAILRDVVSWILRCLKAYSPSHPQGPGMGGPGSLVRQKIS